MLIAPPSLFDSGSDAYDRSILVERDVIERDVVERDGHPIIHHPDDRSGRGGERERWMEGRGYSRP
jgi:hypothetical protein